MKPNRALAFGSVCLTIISIAALSQYGRASENPQTSEGTSKALVEEVRGLRQAVEELAVRSTRLQSLIERGRWEQTAVERLTSEHGSIQASIDSNEAQIQQMEETFKSDEASDSLTGDDKVREQRTLRNNIEQCKERNRQFQVRLMEVAAELQQHKQKVTEIVGALDSLDNSLPNYERTTK